MIFFLILQVNDTKCETKVIENMADMTQFVFDFYQSKLKLWNSIKKKEEQTEEENTREEAKRKLDEEEKLLREKLNESARNSTNKFLKTLNIESDSSSSDSSDEDETPAN